MTEDKSSGRTTDKSIDTDKLIAKVKEIKRGADKREKDTSAKGINENGGSGVEDDLETLVRELSDRLNGEDPIPKDLAEIIIEQVDLQDKDLSGRSFYGSILRDVQIRSSLNSIRAMDYSPQRGLLLIGEKNQGARILFPDTYGSCQFGGDETIRAVKFSPCGRYAFTGGDARVVEMWEVCKNSYSNSNATVDPTTPLEVESLGKLWADQGGVHHIAKIRDIDTIRLVKDSADDPDWLVASICEGGRLRVWGFGGSKDVNSGSSMPKRRDSYSAEVDSLNAEDNGKGKPANSSFHALTFLTSKGHIGITGAYDEEKDKASVRRGAFWIAHPGFERLDKVYDWKNAHNAKSAGWSIEMCQLSSNNGTDPDESSHQVIVYIGDYGQNLHILQVCPFEEDSDSRECKTTRLGKPYFELEETAEETDSSNNRIFSILSNKEKDPEYIVLLLQSGHVVKVALEKTGLPHGYPDLHSAAILSGRHKGRARCGVLLTSNPGDTCGGNVYLYTGGFDHRIIRRKVSPEDGGDNFVWKRLGSSLGTAAVQFDEIKPTSDANTPDLLCTAASDKPLRWTHTGSTSGVWTHGWELADPPETLVNSPEDKTDHHALTVVSNWILISGVYGVRMFLRSTDDDDVKHPIRNQRVWDLATVKYEHTNLAIAACEDSHIRVFKLPPDETVDKPSSRREIETNHGVVRSIASPYGRECYGGVLFVTGGDDRTVRYWTLADKTNGELVEIDGNEIYLKQDIMPGFKPTTWITNVCFSQEHSSESSSFAYIAAASDPSKNENAQIWVWRVRDSDSKSPDIEKFCRFGTSHTRRITALEFLGSETLFSASEDGYVCAWNIKNIYENGSAPPKVHSDNKPRFEKRLSPIHHDHGILDLSIHTAIGAQDDEPKTYLASCDRSGEIRIWDIEKVNAWFRPPGGEDNSTASSTDKEQPSKVEFTEYQLNDWLLNGLPSGSDIHAQIQGASNSYIKLIPSRQYEGTRFRKARFQHTSRGSIPLTEYFPSEEDTLIEVRLDSMIDEIAPLGADFVSGHPQYEDSSEQKPDQ